MPRILALQQVPGSDPPGWMPLEIRAQPPLARRAYSLLLAKPGRSLASIARELGTERHTLSGYARAGRWTFHLDQHLNRSLENLAIMANHEARRSRAATLGSNRVFEGAIEAALEGLIEVDDQGNVKLKPGVEPADVEKLARARQTHVKTTQLLTGEAAANQRASAAAGAPRIVLGGSLVPQPLTVEATVVSSEVSPSK